MGFEQIKVELQDSMGSDRSIAEAAWTSSLTLERKSQKTNADVERIINMLADSGHSVPFEAVVLRYWIKMPIQTDRQHVTYRVNTNNGMSGRYRTMPDEFMSIPDDINKILIKFDNQFRAKARDNYDNLCIKANNYYRTLLTDLKVFEERGTINNSEYKRMREFFRGVLPQNNMTERTTIMNLRSFAHYQEQRNTPEAQPEIRLVAQLMLKELEQRNICPIALDALKKNGWKI